MILACTPFKKDVYQLVGEIRACERLIEDSLEEIEVYKERAKIAKERYQIIMGREYDPNAGENYEI